MSPEERFLAHIDLHKGILFKIAKMYASKAVSKDDLVQEMLYQLWKSYDKFRGESEFKTWLYRVCLNTVLLIYKAESKQPDPKEIQIQEQINITNEDDDKLTYFYNAVKKLNEVEKALIFYFLEGLNHKEIARNMGISEVNTRVKLLRTKDKLKEIIKSQGYEF
jgi:RNA polymerase sigma factor (sigma-70 family)